MLIYCPGKKHYYTWHPPHSVVYGYYLTYALMLSSTVTLYLAGQCCRLHFSTVFGAACGGHSESGTFTTAGPFLWIHLTGRTLSPPPQETLQDPNGPASHLQNRKVLMHFYLFTALCVCLFQGKVEPNHGGQGDSWQVVGSGVTGGGASQLLSCKWLLVPPSMQIYIYFCKPDKRRYKKKRQKVISSMKLLIIFTFQILHPSAWLYSEHVFQLFIFDSNTYLSLCHLLLCSLIIHI